MATEAKHSIEQYAGIPQEPKSEECRATFAL